MKTAIEFLREKEILAEGFTKWKVKFSDEREFDFVELMKEFAKMKCEEQRQKVGNELVTWTEDLSIPNQRKIHDLCQGANEPEM